MSKKLNDYNQKILAAIGTIVLCGLCVLIFLGGYALIKELIEDSNRRNRFDNALTVHDKDEEELAPQIRSQEISFETPRLIDTLQNIYLIPVSQVNLEDPEYIYAEEEGIAALASSYEKGSFSTYRYSGSYNNIVIYSKNDDHKTAVFKSKVNINSFRNYFIKDKQYLLMRGTLTDSNKDGKLKGSDLQEFFIYDIQEKSLQTIGFDKMGLVDYSILFDTDEIVLRFAKDKDGDGEIDSYAEPTFLKVYSIANSKTEDLIDPNLVDEIQSQID